MMADLHEFAKEATAQSEGFVKRARALAIQGDLDGCREYVFGALHRLEALLEHLEQDLLERMSVEIAEQRGSER